ncbi:MAG: ATP-dependent zinc metalloprotease FtsH [Methylobacter sp.]|nr:ATP-dependent zinc metalloprotease FtsH [Methylobacter sp.]MDP2426847.1 ATP-dependent zinc metalloprotease FtsH [Methylobacter sp.]MDP3053565.1 ATP-dependent zinc metalloprotease FtsH [Methylobacter sp.]MDP3360865.1 ATP-dependent zinc metalloprotease FtsH [Methylobacter sp.]MDZ4220355.1 ATP-dependent zinc metalloprotease FtsH [Methylobacter sp.]
MNKSDGIIKGLLTLLASLFSYLKNLLMGALQALSKQAPERELNKPQDKSNGFRWGKILFFTGLFILALMFISSIQDVQRDEISYSQFIKLVKDEKIDKAVVTERFITGVIKPDEPGQATKNFMTVPLWQNDLAQMLAQNKVDFVVRSTDNWLSNLFFNWIIPMLILVLIWSWVMRRTTAGAQSFLNLGDKIRIHQDTQANITFKDVAGADSAKQELNESIDFLKTPEKFQRLGGRMPKGVLLVGPPGTGKTLLARAVSGEAQVPFFNISGSEFIELFVGVGAARVRELFEQARNKAPCIIFIDELDAIGRSRGGPVMIGGHDEREQTLNQLLTEMDGFDTSVGVVVMAATNRPEVLDKALLRAGRFDRQIVVDKPDLQDRIEILNLHTQGLTLAKDIDLSVIARRTPGLVGADLANIANEAAIMATRVGHDKVEKEDFESAIDRILAGPEKKNRVLNPDEKRRVAFHEAGHALVAEHVPTGQPVHKISIIPRGVSALGFTLQLPVEEKFLSTEHELKDQLAILLGGRMAEEIALGSISSGAQNDLEKASDIARTMVCSLGMSKKMGPLTYGKRQQLQFLETETSEYRNYSDVTARLIDTEIIALVEEAETRAREIISANRSALEQLAQVLQEKEVINRDEMMALLGKL